MPLPESALRRFSGHNSQTEGPLLSGPMIGEVGESTARIWAQARDTSTLTLRVTQGGQTIRELSVEPQQSESLCVVFDVDGLAPASTYEYSLRSEHGETARFRLPTAPPDSARRIRLAFGSCYKHYQTESLPIFGSILKEAPDCFLMIGDTAYFLEESDWKDEASMMKAHLRHRNHPSLRPLIANVPTLGIYDDHDFGPNDSDSTFANRAEALRAFKRMWAQRSFGLPALPGVFSTVRIGPAEVFLLDGRYHRRERRRILGEAQLNWLRASLRQSSAPIKIIASGSQLLPEVFGQPPFGWECWRRDAPEELSELLAFLDENDLGGVLLLSGDPHLGYVLHRPGPQLMDGRRAADLWELTSSPLANKPWHAQVMPERFDGSVRTELATANYGIVDIDLDRGGSEIVLGLYSADGGTLAEQPVPLVSLSARTQAPRVAAAILGEGRAYLFRGREYVRLDPRSGEIDHGYPKTIADHWKGAWPSALGRGFDAILCRPDKERLYFFKGNGYTRYDLKHDRVDPGFPHYTSRGWPGVGPGDLDTIFVVPDGAAYFLRGSSCIRYDLQKDHAESGYPKLLAEEFPGVSAFRGEWAGGVDTALCWSDGAIYFLRGSECVRLDPTSGEATEPYALSEGWLGFLRG